MTSVLNTTGLLQTADAAADSNGVTPNLSDPQYRHKIEQAAVKFEGMFITQMLREMRKTTREMSGSDSVFNNPIDSDMLDIADNAVADALAGQKAFGIANAILHQLLPTATPAKES
jgi:flagellar protein FlgJ